MASKENSQHGKKIWDQVGSLKFKDNEIGCETVATELKETEKVETTYKNKTEIDSKKIRIKQSLSDGKQTELLSSSESLQSRLKITLIGDDAKNGLIDKQSIEEALERTTLRDDDAKDYQEQIIETINVKRGEVNNQEEALKRLINEKKKEERNEADKDRKASDVSEYEKEIEQFLKNNKKLDYFKFNEEGATEHDHNDVANSKPNLNTKVTDPNLLDAVDPKNGCSPSFNELDSAFEEPSVICVIEPDDENDVATKVSPSCIDALTENETRSSFLTTNSPVLEPHKKSTEDSPQSDKVFPENDIDSDEENLLKAYLRPSFMLHRDSIAVFKLNQDSSVSLLSKKNNKVMKMNHQLKGEQENLKQIHSKVNSIQESIPEDKTTSLANCVSTSENNKKFHSVDISGSLNDLSDSNCNLYSPIRPFRKKRRCPSVPTISTFEQPEILSRDSNYPVPPKRERRLGKPNHGNNSFNLLMTSKNCSYSLSDIHEMAIEDIEFLSLKKQIDSISQSSLPELFLQSAFRKSKLSVPADVTWSTPEITDIVTEEGVITIKNMQHRASICLLEASLPSLQHHRNHDQFVPDKTPVVSRKRSHTFTSGDRYMYEARNRVKLKKSNTVSNLIRRTFSMKSLKKSDNPPCMPNFFKRYKQRKKNLKRSKNANLSTIHEDGCSNSEKSCHSFASIFMQDDDYGVDENGQTYLERCTANFEPYLSTSVLFPDLPDMRRSSSNMELSCDPPIVYQQFPLKKRLYKRSNSLLQWKPRMKLLSNESAYSLNAEAIKSAHDLLNLKLANKPAITDDSPVPPERSKSKLSLSSVVSDNDFDLNNINDIKVSALSEENVLKNKANPIDDGELMESNESLEVINEEILHDHVTKNGLQEAATEDKLEATQSTECFSAIFSSNSSFNPVEEIVVSAVFEENKSPKESVKNLEGLNSEEVNLTSGNLTKVVEERKEFERNRIDSISNHSKALKEISEKIHGIQKSNHLHHEVLMNNAVKKISIDVENDETNTSVKAKGGMETKKDRTDFWTKFGFPSYGAYECLQGSVNEKEKEPNSPLDSDNVSRTNEGDLTSKNSGVAVGNLSDVADERQKFQRKRIDSIKQRSEALNEITEKIHGIQECNRLNHEVLMNNFVRRFSFDFENAGMGHLSDSEVKIDGEMEAKKAISDFLKTLDSPTLLESLDKSNDEPSIQMEELDPQLYCSVEHLEDLHRQPVSHDEELENCKEETGKVFTFPYGNASQSFRVDGEQLARECTEGTINVKLQNITDMYTKDILHQTRKLSGDYERCASPYISPQDMLNPDKRLGFHNVISDTEDEIFIGESALSYTKAQSHNILSQTATPKAASVANNQEDKISNNAINSSLVSISLDSSSVDNDESIFSEHLQMPPSTGPKEEVLKQIINKNSLLFQTLYSTSMSQLQKSNVYHFPYQTNSENVVPQFLYTCDQILALSKISPESPTTSPLHSPIISIRHSSNEHGTKVVEVESPISMRKYFVTAVKDENTPPDSPSVHPLKTSFDVNDTLENVKDAVKEELTSVDCVDSANKIKDNCGTVFPDQSFIPISYECEKPNNNATKGNFENKSIEIIDHVINLEELNPVTKVDSKISNELESQKMKKKKKSNLKVIIPNSSLNATDMERDKEKESSSYVGKNLDNEDGKINNPDIKTKLEDVINEIDLTFEVNSEAKTIKDNHANNAGECREELLIKREFVEDSIEIKEGVKENRSSPPGNQFKDSKSESELKHENGDSEYQSACDGSISKEPLNVNFKSSVNNIKENWNKKSKKKSKKSKVKYEVLFDSIIKPENYDQFIHACKTEPNRLEKGKVEEPQNDNELNNKNSEQNGIKSECKIEIENENILKTAKNENSNSVSAKRSEFISKIINEDSRDNEVESGHLPVTEGCSQLASDCTSNHLDINYSNQPNPYCVNNLDSDNSNLTKTDFNNGLETECNFQRKADGDKKLNAYTINGMETCNTQLESNFDAKLESKRNNQFETEDNQLYTFGKPELENNCINTLNINSKNQQKIGSTSRLDVDCKEESDSNELAEENNMTRSNKTNESEKRCIYKSELKSISLVNKISSKVNLIKADHCENNLENGEEILESSRHIEENNESLIFIAGKVGEYNNHDQYSENHTKRISEKDELDLEEINCAEEECYNHIKECCSIQCNCNDEDETIKILAVHKKKQPETFLPITVRTWEERQVGERTNVRSTVCIPNWVQNGLCLKPEMFQPKDTSLGHPHIEQSCEEFERNSRAENQSSPRSNKEEEKIPQQDRCVEIYPETLRQRQRNMAPSPSKVDIKNWENNSGGSDDDSKAGKKFLPSVKALRSQFENGKSANRDYSPSPPPSISPPIRENLNNLGRTSSNSSTSSLVMSSLEASSGFSSLASSQATSELLSKSPDDEPVEPIFNQFNAVGDDDKESMCQAPSTIGWNPQPLLKKLYYIPEAPKIQSQGTNYVNIDGYLEKLPSGRKKATFWNAWKRRYFVAKDGTLYYYQNNQTEKPNMKLPLMGGKVEIMDQNMVNIDDGDKNMKSASMLGIDDGKGHYVVVRCPTRQEAERWKKALDTHTVEDFSSQYVQPWPRPTNPTLLRDTLIIDIGSSSVRAGVLASQPTLPQLFFPSVVATNRETRMQIWGTDALMPHLRTNSSVAFPIRPSHKISKFSVDLNSISSLLQKTFKDLKVDPKNYNIQLSVPRVLNQITQVELLKILFEKFGVKAVNLTHQSILALYAYNVTSGIVVDIGERIDVVPVTDGYIVDGGVSRIPYGGYRILDHIRQFLFQRNLSLVNEVDSYVIRQCLETVCYSAQHYNTEKQRCTLNNESFEKTVPLAEFFPNSPQYEAFRDISLDFGRFQATEGLFNPDAWGLDHPGLHKLVHKAIQECSMDIRKEMSRSIFLSGGLSQLPGISERLTVELDNLTPPAIHPKVHSSPYRYHAAYIGACVLAESPAFVQSKITKEEWQKQGNSALRKWAL